MYFMYCISILSIIYIALAADTVISHLDYIAIAFTSKTIELSSQIYLSIMSVGLVPLFYNTFDTKYRSEKTLPILVLIILASQSVVWYLLHEITNTNTSNYHWYQHQH